jgi:hypothetical protein
MADDWFDRVPKVELHLHLEGAIPHETLWALVQKYGGDPDLPDMAALEERFRYRDFPHFVETWIWQAGFIREHEDFALIAEAVARDLAGQNVRYAEAFFSAPDFARHGLTTQGIATAIRSGLDQIPEIEVALLIDRDDGRLAASPNERLAVVQDGVVFDRGRHDVASLGRHLERGMQRSVVRFRPAAGEDDFVRLAAEQGRHPLMRQIGRLLHLGAEAMRARGIAVVGGQERHHLLQHFGIEPGAGIVIQINNFSRSRHGKIGVSDRRGGYSGGRGSFPGCCA